MQILYIDIASHDGLIAVCKDDSVITSKALNNRVSDAEIIAIVEKMVPDFQELTHIACVVGPGGFTSLRVAVTFANVLADQLGIPLAAIHLSSLYHARVGGSGVGGRESGNYYWLHSTQKDHLFVCGGEYKEPTLVEIDTLLPTSDSLPPIPWAGELIDAHREKVGSEPMDLRETTDVLPVLLAAQEYKKKQITPWYGR